LKISNFEQAVATLQKYIPLSREITGKNITLERMTPLMAAVGNPQDNLKIVHLAGTSGKTSTTYYVTELLIAAGQKVGTTVSPHIDSITERVQINGLPLSESEFTTGLIEFLDLVVKAKLEPTYFEILIAFAYWYFAKVKVDYAVIETGLGGLHDGTNVASSRDKVCIITDIGYDHMHVLGNTLSSITRQKAGIIWPGNKVFMYRQADEITNEITAWCNDKKAQLTLLDQPHLQQVAIEVKNLKNLPAYQQRNWLLAHAAYDYVAARDGLANLSPDELEHALSVQVPARMDVRSINGKTVVMDGAHNGQKMRAFVSSFILLYPDKKATVLLSLKKCKEYDEVLPLLLPITDKLIVCDFTSVQDTHISSVDTEELAQAARKAGFENISVIADLNEAYNLLQSQTKDIAVITGSFYLIGELRNNFKELKNA